MSLPRPFCCPPAILAALLSAAMAAGGVVGRASADPVEIHPSRDNTLYQYQGGYVPGDPDSGLRSNGQGNFFSAGLTTGGQTQPAQIQRGLLHFDVAGQVPSGSRVTRASLGLHAVDVPKQAEGDGPADFWLVALLPGQLQQPWGEGASSSNVAYGGDPGDSQPGRGRAAENGDATWYQTVYDSGADNPPTFLGSADSRYWTAEGALGDAAYTPGFAPAGSVADVRYLDESLNQYTWTFDQPTDQMLIDIQSWIDNPGDNLGWVLVGQEGLTSSKRGFASRDHDNVDWWPTLTVWYTQAAVPEPSSWLLALVGAALLAVRLRGRRRPAGRRGAV